MKQLIFPILFSVFAFVGCIGDDFVNDMVDPELRITNPVDSIELNTSYQFESAYLNNVGMEEFATVDWQSSNPEIIEITGSGLATAIQLGSSVITAIYNDGTTILESSVNVSVGETTVVASTDRTGTIVTTSSYTLTGDFVLKENGNDVILEIADNYKASSSLPGLYVYLTNNPNTTSGALEIEKVTTFSGAHSYTIPNVGINDFNYVLYFCKPFNVKVGDGEIN